MIPAEVTTGNKSERALRRALRVSSVLFIAAFALPGIATLTVAGENPSPDQIQASAAQQAAANQHGEKSLKLSVPDKTRQEFATLPEGKRLKILGRLIRSGQPDAAEILLNTAPFTGQFGQNRNLFIKAMIEHQRGNVEHAIRIYRTVLANDPKLTAVRAELARALYDNKQDRSAIHHLYLLRASAVNETARRTFDIAMQAIESRRTWTFNVWGSIAPSTNFNNGTSLEVINVGGLDFEVGNQAREKSGIGVRGGGNISYNHTISNDISLIVSSGTNLVQYDDVQFDQTSLNQSALLRYRKPEYSVAAGVSASQGWYGEDEFLWSVGPEIIASYMVSPKAQLYANLRHQWNTYEAATYRNGWTTSINTELKYALNDTTILYVKADAGRQQTKREHLSNWNGGGGLGVYHDLPGGLTGMVEGYANYSVGDGDYPLLGAAREQTRATGRVTLTKRDFYWRGLAPQLEYTYTRNFSNDALSRYDSHGLALTLTRAF